MDCIRCSRANSCECAALTRVHETQVIEDAMINIRQFTLPRWQAMLAGVAFILMTTESPLYAQQKFGTPEDAVQALVNAVRAANKKQLMAILGPEGREIVSSGDEVADAAVRAEFLAQYETRNQIVRKNDSAVELLVGTIEWPLP